MESRTKKIARNVSVSLFCHLITIILGFVCRKALIESLGLVYVGANSLFSSIVGLLSFVELGIGNAIIYSLYKPIAENDQLTISAYINFFKRVYTIIAIVVLILGSSIIPFLNKIVHVDSGITENLYLMYFLTIVATSCSYLFASHRTLLIADQKQYIEKIIYQFCHIGQVLTQIIVLFVFKSYYLFLIAQIIFVLLNNIIATTFVCKHYPYLRENVVLSSYQKADLFLDIKAMFLYKVGSAFLNSVSGVFISYYCGLAFLGKIANYILILGTLTGIIIQINRALSASVGNKNVTGTKEETRESFKLSFFVSIWLTGFFLVSFLLLASPFLSLMFGSKVVIDDFSVVVCLGVLYFVQDTHAISSTYRYSMGVFRPGRYVPLVASMLNMLLMVLFYHIIGVPGLYIATIVTRVLTYGIVDSYLILGGLNGTLSYFKSCGNYILVIIVLFVIAKVVLQHIVINSVLMWIVAAIAVSLTYHCGWLLIFYRTKVCKKIIGHIRTLVNK